MGQGVFQPLSYFSVLIEPAERGGHRPPLFICRLGRQNWTENRTELGPEGPHRCACMAYCYCYYVYDYNYRKPKVLVPERAGRQPSWAGSTRSSPRKVWASQYYKLGDSSRHQLLLQPLLPPSRFWIERPEMLPRPSAAAPEQSEPHWDQKVLTAALVSPSSF